MKALGLIIVALVGAILVYATIDFPPFGDPESPASLHVSPRYLEKTLEETAVPNAVTSVLADYRSFDTMFETTVIFCAGVACFLLLRVPRRRPPAPRQFRHRLTGLTFRIKDGGEFVLPVREFEPVDSIWTPYDLIIETICRYLIPFIQIFGLYVIAHGHYSPGGGFQGGVILGASIILLSVSHNLRTALKRMGEKTSALFSPLGVLIYTGTGVLCLVLGYNFLDYQALAALLPGGPIMARSHGIFLVEVGVGMAVMGTMVWIFKNLASRGRYDEGL
ncbi:MAG: Na(+)/H(+) antiporter subunit B [Deltaproteobacteria bacterium]|nr:Na(+)/H(+) antiporter subunit B [Deltaproteobacteria bacterium]